MTGLFYSFDLKSMFVTSWIMMILSVLFIKFYVWKKNNMIMWMTSKLSTFIKNDFKVLLKNNYFSSNIMFFLSIFIFIFLNNFISLFSYIFSATSHILFSFSAGFILWLSFIILGYKNNVVKNLTHLIPEGTPMYLISFMVFIETLSVMVRPITLSVRLAANITAGHLLLSLIAWGNSMIMMTSLAQILMFVLEIMVSIIQAYVFSMLLVLYLSENS